MPRRETRRGQKVKLQFCGRGIRVAKPSASVSVTIPAHSILKFKVDCYCRLRVMAQILVQKKVDPSSSSQFFEESTSSGDSSVEIWELSDEREESDISSSCELV